MHCVCSGNALRHRRLSADKCRPFPLGRRRSLLVVGLLWMGWLLAPAAAHAAAALTPDAAAQAATRTQDDAAPDGVDSDEPQRGLLQVWQSAQISERRIVPRPILLDTAAAERPQPLQVTWEGQLLVREPGTYQWHAAVSGTVTVTVGDRVVLTASSTDSGFISGQSGPLTPGDHPLRIEYAATEAVAERRLQLFWSAEQFTLEPLPADVLSHVAADSRLLAQQQYGEQLTDALRCAACHQSLSPLPAQAAPDLDRIHGSQSEHTLQQRLQQPTQVVANSRMPAFDFTAAESASVAAYLRSVSRQPDSARKLTFKDNDVAQGMVLLTSLGCVACHTLPGPAAADASAEATFSTNPWAGPDLRNVAERRSGAWLAVWLKEPATLNPSHRMPVFDLTADEQRQLVAALTTRTADSGAQPPASEAQSSAAPDTAEQIQQGRALIAAANCAACHRIPGLEASTPTVPGPPVHSVTQADSPSSCLRPTTISQPSSAAVRRPRFSLRDSERSALRAWLAVVATHRPERSALERGQWLLARNSCTACHDRDGSQGLSAAAAALENLHADLRGRSQALVPPALTAVGDKLRDDYLRTAVAGRQTTRRLPWLAVRMPQFRHTAAELNDLLTCLITADRIPDAADAARPEIAEAARSVPVTTSDLLTGNQLTGAAGFNCVACHAAGAFEPRNVALGTRGSDLLTMGARLRPRFFQRWMKNPIRVVAGIEMPAIKRAAPGILDESLNQQMATIWRAISDPRFTAPTVLSRYEQFVTVAPGAPPAIIRDVFTIGSGKQREGVARALAVGFSNGHNLLLDLDSMQLRQWTVGEFARQRTEGKSWFWDTAGVPVASTPGLSPAAASAYELVTPAAASGAAADGVTLAAVLDEGRSTELVRYQSDQHVVDVWYRVHFPTAATGTQAPTAQPLAPHSAITAWNNPAQPVQSVLVHEVLAPLADGPRSGWFRALTVVESPASTALRIRLPNVTVDPAFQVQQTVQTGDQPPVALPLAGATVTLQPNQMLWWSMTSAAHIRPVTPPALPRIITTRQQITSTPGFSGERLPIDASIMPTAITWLPDGRMAFTSLRGHVWLAADTDADGLEDQLTLFEEGLAAPFGILADGDAILVAHKPELLRLRDTDGDGRADQREIVASGWGYTDDYHDWTSGLIRDAQHNLFVGLGSDYSQKDRPQDRDRWRGTVLKIDPSGVPTPMAFAFRYPMGLALNSRGQLFATDNQGVQNTFNEINHVQPGRYYGVPSRHDPAAGVSQEAPALQVPHPWTRSVNSILFFPDNFAATALAGHGIGCEYDLRFLLRFTVQDVDGVLQGAVYPFSRPNLEAGGSNFIGPICSAVRPDGSLYVGSIWDSGWQGGPNTGGIERLTPQAVRPNGIREVQAVPDGFRITFFDQVDVPTAASTDSYSVQGFTRHWGGSYATPDADRHQCVIARATVDTDRRSVRLVIPELKTGYVYDLSIVKSLTGEAGEQQLPPDQAFWPATAHYTLNRIPGSDR